MSQLYDAIYINLVNLTNVCGDCQTPDFSDYDIWDRLRQVFNPQNIDHIGSWHKIFQLDNCRENSSIGYGGICRRKSCSSFPMNVNINLNS